MKNKSPHDSWLWNIFLNALVIIQCLSASLSHACEWILTPTDLLSPTKTAFLSRQFPLLKTAEDMQTLMEKISTSTPVLNLEAHFENGICHIMGTAAKPIGKIEISSTIRSFKNELIDHFAKYIGQVNSPEMRGKITQDISEFLKNRGYFQAQVNLKTLIENGSTRYKFEVEENYPCQIRQIETGFILPEKIELKLDIGDICDRESIEEAIDRLEKDLRNSGYNQQQIRSYRLTYDEKSNSALLFVPGTIGLKVKYKVVSPIQQFWSSDLNEIDPSIVDPDTMMTEINRKYRAQGYDDVKIAPPRKEKVGKDAIRYVFYIDPGKQYYIANIQVEGCRFFSDEKCLQYMELESLLTLDTPPLNHELIRNGIESLKSKYNLQGFWNAEIHYPRITKDPVTGSSKLVYYIEEGSRRIFNKMIITGNRVVTSEEIADLYGSDPQSPLVWGELSTFEKDIKTIYQKLGYIYAEVKIDLMKKKTLRDIQVTMVVNIQENVRVTFGDITISGLVHTDPVVVRRELRFETGEWFNPDKIEETRRALINLGIFSSVSLMPSDHNSLTESQRMISYTVVLTEGKPGAISFGPGWSLDNGFRYNMEASYNNIGGLGRQIFLKTSLSEEKRQQAVGGTGARKTLIGRSLGIGYVEPYLLDLPISGTISINNHANANQDKWNLTNSGELALAHVLRKWLVNSRVTGFYGRKNTRIETGRPHEFDLIGTHNLRIGEIGTRFSLDRRNSISWPSGGYNVDLETSIARYGLEGNLKYFLWNISDNHYFGLSENFVFATRLSFTAYEGVEREGDGTFDVLPSSERLHAGGAASNRGFRQQQLGPIYVYNDHDNIARTEFLGGTRRSVMKLELRYQAIEDTMGISGFLDSSNSFFTTKELNRYQGYLSDSSSSIIDNYHYNFEDLITSPSLIFSKNYISTGLALSYLTPLGSFNLSYGVPMKRHLERKCEPNTCVKRGDRVDKYILNGVFNINVGANF